jgi:hypothetical protein
MAQAMGSRWLSNSRATAEIESGGELHRLQLPALVEVSQWMADLFLYAVAGTQAKMALLLPPNARGKSTTASL